jgi:hypothetical protein
VAEHEVEAAIAGHDVLAEQFPHGLELVVNERRRRWNDFFHDLSFAIDDLRELLESSNRT